MSIKIYKYELPLTFDLIELELPSIMQIINVGQMNERLFFWALVDIDSDLTKRYFKIVPTGDEITNPDSFYIIQTVIMPNGYVWHVFEIKENR
jgi:hypothetical protein